MDDVRAYLLELQPEDEGILENLVGYLEQPRAKILRWALRWWAAEGPWPVSDSERQAVLSHVAGGLEVGPHKRRVRECPIESAPSEQRQPEAAGNGKRAGAASAAPQRKRRRK